ncbi:hypothetical protein SAMN05216360_104266 [Methylobacterium phyllostachyos]|uniref:Uncharacterized protein n=1 Tax=Methylobacterium phyllostachyos TaxID=582672 RepID=A0A1G9X7A9_9HYPH|nr:hypothetical protein [Methylobacterium phyllostachyos]SDM92205.1 hypothetical protein SAMN05216360_104266 [Methylobacterium phyllostachyos]
MIDLALDPSETRETRTAVERPRRAFDLRVLLFSLAGIGVLGGFGVAASTLMAGLAAPPPITIKATAGRAADWPDLLKDGLPAVAGTATAGAIQAEAKPAEPVAQTPRMASLPSPFTPAAAPIKPPAAPPAAKLGDAAEPPARRIPTPTQVAPLAASRQVVPLPPTRTVALQPPRASETVRAHAQIEPAPKPTTAAPAVSAEKAAKPAPKVVAAKPTAPAKVAEKAKRMAPTAVAQAEAAEPEETEVLGIKLPSLAPAGRKLKESVDALGDAVKSVF